MEVSSEEEVGSMMNWDRPPSDVGSGQDVDDLFGDLFPAGFLPPPERVDTAVQASTTSCEVTTQAAVAVVMWKCLLQHR